MFLLYDWVGKSVKILVALFRLHLSNKCIAEIGIFSVLYVAGHYVSELPFVRLLIQEPKIAVKIEAKYSAYPLKTKLDESSHAAILWNEKCVWPAGMIVSEVSDMKRCAATGLKFI